MGSALISKAYEDAPFFSISLGVKLDFIDFLNWKIHSRLMKTAVRRIQFCAGHRVHKHESKCATLHGHNYVAYFHATAPELDSIGRIIDFSVLKEKIGGWIDKFWDHTMILFEEDSSTIALVDKAPAAKPTYVMPINPTAENMAHYLLNKICPKLLEGTGVEIVKVVLWETENCYAEVTKDK